MMFRNRFEGMGLLGVPPTPTYSLSIFAFIASLTSPGLRSFGAAGAGGSCRTGDGPRKKAGSRQTRAVAERGAPTAKAAQSRSAAFQKRKTRAPTRETKKRRGVVYACPRMGCGARPRTRECALGLGDALAHLFGRGLVLRTGEDGVQRADGLVRLGLGGRAPRGAASRPDGGSGDDAIRLAHRRGGRAARGDARARAGRHDDRVSGDHRGVHVHDERRSEDTRRERE